MATFNPHFLCLHECSKNTLTNLIQIFLPPCTDANSHAFFLGSFKKSLNNGLLNVGEQLFVSLPCYDFQIFFLFTFYHALEKIVYLLVIVTFCNFIIFLSMWHGWTSAGARWDLKPDHISLLATLLRAGADCHQHCHNTVDATMLSHSNSHVFSWLIRMENHVFHRSPIISSHIYYYCILCIW